MKATIKQIPVPSNEGNESSDLPFPPGGNGFTEDELAEFGLSERSNGKHKKRKSLDDEIEVSNKLMNSKYCVIKTDGPSILEFPEKGNYNGLDLFWHTVTGMRIFHAGNPIIGEVKNHDRTKKTVKLDRVQTWIKSETRRSYSDVILADAESELIREDGEKVLNLWRGFYCEPRAGKWPVLNEFLTRLCGADEKDGKATEYLFKYLAWKAQHPVDIPEVAIVITAKEGTGKGMLIKLLRRWFGNFFVFESSKNEHVSGRFAKSPSQACWMVYNESIISKSLEHTKVLLNNITEKYLSHEEKNKPIRTRENHCAFIVITNDVHAILAAVDSRRFFIIHPDESTQGHTEYWKTVNAAIEGKEAQALLHDLLKVDLSNFMPREGVPVTVELKHQRKMSQKEPGIWLEACAASGSILGSEPATQFPPKKWPEIDDFFTNQELFFSFINFCNAHKLNVQNWSPLKLAKTMEKMGVLSFPEQNLRRVGEKVLRMNLLVRLEILRDSILRE